MNELPFFSPGTELKAEHVRRIIDEVNRRSRLSATPPLEIVEESGGRLIRLLRQPQEMRARVIDSGGDGETCRRLTSSPDDTSGDAALVPYDGEGELPTTVTAYSVGRRAAVGDTVMLYRVGIDDVGLGTGGGTAWLYEPPRLLRRPEPPAAILAGLTSSAAGGASFVEADVSDAAAGENADGFAAASPAERPPETGYAGSPSAAFGATAAASASGEGDLVRLYRTRGAATVPDDLLDPDDDAADDAPAASGDEAARWFFEAPASPLSSGAGFLAVLMPRSAAVVGGDPAGVSPASDAAGRYAFRRLVASAGALSAVPASDRAASCWPLRLARETNRRADVPPGTVAVVYDDGDVFRRLDEVAAEPFFAGMTPAAVLAFLAAAGSAVRVTDGVTYVADRAYRFTHWGDAAFDAILLDQVAFLAGGYPSEGVSVAGGTPFVSASRTAVGDATVWTPDGRLSGQCRDVNGRKSAYGTGRVVRVYPRWSADAGGVVYLFESPPAGFWASVVGAAAGPADVGYDDAAGYDCVETFPGLDAATGAAGTPRTVTAYELSGRTDVPAGTPAWLDAGRDGVYRFGYAGGRPPEVTLLRVTGEGVGVVEADPFLPGDEDTPATYAVLPQDATILPAVGTRHPAFRADDGSYVVCAPDRPAMPGRPGAVSADDQLLPAGTFAGRLYVGPYAEGVPMPKAGVVKGLADVFDDTPFAEVALFDDAGFPGLLTTGGTALELDDDALNVVGTNACLSIRGYDGVLDGVYSLPTVPGVTVEITFAGGVFVQAQAVGTPSSLFSGTFPMTQFIAGTPFTRTVTVGNGVVESVA